MADGAAVHCAGEYAKRGMVMQLHYSCLRNPNSRAFAALGPDTGFDCVALTDSGGALAKLLDELKKTDSLLRTILYTRKAFEEAVALAQEKNIDFVEKGIKKCVVYLDPGEFKTTWLGNKAVYRTRMAIADGGELIVLAPGVTRFGEDLEVDKLIRKYGYNTLPDGEEIYFIPNPALGLWGNAERFDARV